MPTNPDHAADEPAHDAAREADTSEILAERIVTALMALASERAFDEISLSDIAGRAGTTLAEFRRLYPSKGAVLSAFMRRIDVKVLEGSGEELAGEAAKERLFDVLMRRLDALKPYRAGIESIAEWARREPLAAAALSRPALNSMRFMLEAADIDTSGSVGAMKIRGLALAWSRLIDGWFHDDEPGLDKTMAALDKMLVRGGQFVARAEDVHRLTSPLRSMARAAFNRRTSFRERVRERWSRGHDDERPASEERL